MFKKLVTVAILFSCLSGCSNQSTPTVPVEKPTIVIDEVEKPSKIVDKNQDKAKQEQVNNEEKKEEIKPQQTHTPNKKKEEVNPSAKPVEKPTSKPVEKPKPTPTPVPTLTPTPKPEEKPKACPGGMDENVACDIIFDSNFYYEKLSSDTEASNKGEYYLNDVVYIGELEITNYSIQPVYRNDRSIAFYGLNLWSNGTLIQ